MELKVHDKTGKSTSSKAKLSDSIFGVDFNEHAVYLDVKQYRAQQRQGTHKAKERADIAGSTKKIKRQKGTGTARAGSIKSPIFRGGGRVFGPAPRDYSFKLNKKVKRVARKSALSAKAKSDSIMVIEDLSFESPKTKDFVSVLNNMGAADKKSLIVLGDANKNVYLSARNLKGVKVISASQLNTYDIMEAKALILTKSSIEIIENTLS
ncbi:50S ribosomal protein L4 [Salibacter sp.]|uniref:50S ribosomal protein L4 n=1 Tax=Salibacter sp. TaxID=2010995 RepID=UPI00287076B0|nr:50S ribosomal protein L4 [Salibacter sp.]MDR9398966.1 50S ribosomal protein L4 [Salibacter sp.]MDR9488001.1 50S ribosomal protein L4 [Salibacter sp.]